MGRCLAMLTTDKGIFFSVFDSTADQFRSPCRPTLDEAIADAVRLYPSISEEGWKSDGVGSSLVSYMLTRERIEEVLRLIATLLEGVSIGEEEALKVANLRRFLIYAASVSSDHPGLANLIEEIDALGLRPEGRDDEDVRGDVLDQAQYRAYAAADERRRFIVDPSEPVPVPSEADNRLVGRYLTRLFAIAGITGDHPISPVEMIDRSLASQ